MSTELLTEELGEQPTTYEYFEGHTQRVRIEVTDLDTDRALAYVRENVGPDRAAFERRGDRTFVVVDR